ncbi:transcriptional regulator Spx [Pseudogracilibacillus auburnensis]|uniref:Regulatory protein spx n=1 Tax=Pseudogracilibacillus auburnensis TaxID=1494959 RepID=A0A2V3VKL3_9BACI|nr:transcriptional regulator Spx [Pseudogracilibacillus auburnensis]MBO1004195.1 transcriptional regulator Spx [Pseudogracilibacillus auburnensis]PXW82317.1 regulatory protein spx [Pseudogracilibacillus auburnensis]
MDITVYGSSCASTRKSKRWFKEHAIPFEYRDITRKPLIENEMQAILRMTEEGTKDIISTRSNIYKELNLDIDNLPLKQLYELIYKFPKLLRQPIIVGVNKLQVGFDEYNIRQFIPREERKKLLNETLSMT